MVRTCDRQRGDWWPIILNSQNSNGDPRRLWTGVPLSCNRLGDCVLQYLCHQGWLPVLYLQWHWCLSRALNSYTRNWMWKRSVVQKKHTVKKTIPFVQKWYQGTDHQLFHQEIYGNDAGSNLTCVWILSLTSLKRSSKVVIQKSKVCAACFGKCCVGILEESTNLGRS